MKILIQLLQKFWYSLFAEKLNVLPMNQMGGHIPLTRSQVRDEIKNRLEKEELSYNFQEGILFKKNKNCPNGMAIKYGGYFNKILAIYPDSYQISHTTIESLKRTLDQEIVWMHKNKPRKQLSTF